MKRKLKDENGFPLNYNPDSFYQQPEMYFPLPNRLYNTDPNLYMVTTWGRVYNTKTQKFVPRQLMLDTNRYVGIMLKTVDNQDVSIIMHQLIARMFVFPKPVVPGQMIVPNHIDGIKWHNEPYNLEWTTLSENTIHADQNDLIERPYGEDNGHAALTDDQYREICRLTQEGYFPYQINKIMNLGIDITNIAQKIRTGDSETLISQEYDFSNIPRNDYRKFSEEDVHFICRCLQDYPDLSYNDILLGLDYDIENLDRKYVKKLRDTISTIKRRVSYIQISKDYNF